MNLLTKLLSHFFTDEKERGFMMQPSTPEIISCNKFISHFCRSHLTHIEVSESGIRADRLQLFGDLAGIPFERIRNRVRVISNLDPVHNTKEERGRVKLSYRNEGKMVDVELLTLFPVDPARFVIEKIKPTEPGQ